MTPPLKTDPRSRRAYVLAGKDWREVALAAKEFDVLHLLLQHPGRVLERAELLEKVWHKKPLGEVGPEVVDRCVGGLRRKLGSHGRLIKTVRGCGYGLETP